MQADQFGWPDANFIGSLPQQNQQNDDWPEYWRSQRLEPQLSHAADAGRLSRSDVSRFQQLFARLDELLKAGNREGASFLHGDLWSGNAHATENTIAAIDPSAYYGGGEKGYIDYLTLAQQRGEQSKPCFDTRWR